MDRVALSDTPKQIELAANSDTVALENGATYLIQNQAGQPIFITETDQESTPPDISDIDLDNPSPGDIPYFVIGAGYLGDIPVRNHREPPTWTFMKERNKYIWLWMKGGYAGTAVITKK